MHPYAEWLTPVLAKEILGKKLLKVTWQRLSIRSSGHANPYATYRTLLHRTDLCRINYHGTSPFSTEDVELYRA